MLAVATPSRMVADIAAVLAVPSFVIVVSQARCVLVPARLPCRLPCWPAPPPPKPALRTWRSHSRCLHLLPFHLRWRRASSVSLA